MQIHIEEWQPRQRSTDEDREVLSQRNIAELGGAVWSAECNIGAIIQSKVHLWKLRSSHPCIRVQKGGYRTQNEIGERQSKQRGLRCTYPSGGVLTEKELTVQCNGRASI